VGHPVPPAGRIRPMCRILHFVAALDWVAVSALIVAVVSFFVARKTLLDAEDFWKQQKWFDLYAKADEAYDTFERYRTTYKVYQDPTWNPGHTEDWNNLMFLIRRVHSMAMVFPKHLAIDKLVGATSFNTPQDAFQDERRQLFFDAVQDMREMALLDSSILEMRKRTLWSLFKLW
jgi:hypothetical protein